MQILTTQDSKSKHLVRNLKSLISFFFELQLKKKKKKKKKSRIGINNLLNLAQSLHNYLKHGWYFLSLYKYSHTCWLNSGGYYVNNKNLLCSDLEFTKLFDYFFIFLTMRWGHTSQNNRLRLIVYLQFRRLQCLNCT